MLIVVCARGLVGWIISLAAPDIAVATCVNDQQQVELTRTSSMQWVPALESIRAHSVALQGTMSQVIVLPRQL